MGLSDLYLAECSFVIAFFGSLTTFGFTFLCGFLSIYQGIIGVSC